MLNRRSFTALLLGGTTLLMGCGGKEWKTDYADVIDPNTSKDWHIAKIDVRVPDTLSISEKNSYAPNADIVWHGDKPGNRHEQVDAIITTAAENAAKALHGSHDVNLVIQVANFHALTDKTRYSLENTGVHNITFTAQIFDTKTGAPLSPPDTIIADLIAYSGAQAVAAEARGETQKVRIIAHVTKVLQGWLGAGPDARNSFKRRGR